MSLRKALSLFTAAFAFAGAAAWAQAPAAPYSMLTPPQATDGSGKIEVIEFFWYGCPHCYSIEPAVNAWLKSAPKDVVFKRVPAYPSDAWGGMAVMYYTLEAMGLLEQYHSKVFDAMHKQNVNLANKGKRDEWLKANGIDPAKYAEVEKSFTVNTKVARAPDDAGLQGRQRPALHRERQVRDLRRAGRRAREDLPHDRPDHRRRSQGKELTR